MAQISRPFQIALAAVVLLGGVYLFALKGDSKSSESSAPAPASSAAKPSSAPSAAESEPTAPGVAGLSRAVQKAHGAVATSEQNARNLEQKSAAASSNSSQATGGTAAQSQSPSHSSSSASSATGTSTKTSKSAAGSHPKHAPPSKQKTVEAELHSGDVVVLLFWNHKGSDDDSVHSVVQGFVHADKVAVHVSPADEVADYGSVTRRVQVYGTPTVLVIGKHGKTKTVTGLTDHYSLQQAISEARKA